MPFVPETITAEVMEHADGRPVAYIDATAIAVFAYQEPDGTHVIDIHTRDDISPGLLRLLLDGQSHALAPKEALSADVPVSNQAPPQEALAEEPSGVPPGEQGQALPEHARLLSATSTIRRSSICRTPAS